MLLEVALVSLLAGATLVLLVQFMLLKWYVRHTSPVPPRYNEQFPAFVLPQALKSKLLGDWAGQHQKEACLWLNLMGQFLFRELRDTSIVRRWVMRKINLEFQELLQTTSGKLLAQIIVRDFSLGSTCPVIGGVNVQNIILDDGDLIQTLDVCMDVEYDGGFTLGVDVVLPFNKMAFISVTLRRLSGRARLQLTRQPYTHWSFSFLQEPEVQFEVESHFEGRPLSQVAALIVNQLRRTIRKKHTLPNYKMRYRPVFPRPEINVPTCRLLVNGQCITLGRLCITFIKCSRLTVTSQDATLYCILSADAKPWRELVRGKEKVWVTMDVEISKGQADSIGMNFKDEYLLDRYGMAVTVDYVHPDSPAARADLKKGDVLISVGPARILSAKHAAKLFKNAGEKFPLKLERPQLKASQDGKSQDDAVSVRDVETEVVENSLMEDGEEFVNITMHHAGTQGTAQDTGTSSQNSSGATTNEINKSTLGPRSGVGQNGSQGSVKKDHSPGRDSSQVETLTPVKKPPTEDEATSVYSVDVDSDSDDESSPVMKTREVPASHNPRWHDPLTFDLNEQHAFLNVCVWCHNTEHTDLKGDRPTPPPHRDILLGQVSVPVNMLTLQCLMTMQGDSKQTLELQPGQLKTGVTRKTMAGHIGFEPQRCYGDITLRFQFTPANLSELQRTQLTQGLDPTDPADLASVGIVPAPPESSQDEQQSDSESTSGEGRHLFAKTQFNSATYCNFCGKKIWLKEAFQCTVCGMISHKKCVDKCRTETLCSQDGPRRRCAPGEFWRTPVRTKKPPEEEAGPQVPKPQTRSSRILSKFTKDSSAKAADKDTTKAGASPRLWRRRKEVSTKVSDESEPAMPTELKFLDGTLDDTAMNSAKQLGRQLFSQLDIGQRKARLDQLVNKMQAEIDQESANKVALTYDLQEAETDAARSAVKVAIAKSDEKMQALMLLLLQYCAGLQHCLDQEEEVRQQTATAIVPPNVVVHDAAVGGSTSNPLEDPECTLTELAVVAGLAGAEVLTVPPTTAEEEEKVVAQVLTELIHTDDSSSSDEENNNDEDSVDGAGVERFRPIHQQNLADVDDTSPISGSVLSRAQATLAGIHVEKEFYIEKDEDSTSV
ncbi:hypothetical protein BaRGS_00012202 [Batillaria attramentaria]|uniref:PDZ domain-containing protein 8 n=1 Tax=Batillaria attramentaria TaxID=370345 RepID=A0ABD0LB06_9CAEN